MNTNTEKNPMREAMGVEGDLLAMLFQGMFPELKNGNADVEMFCLESMLDDAGIPYETEPGFFGGKHLAYFGHKGKPEPKPGVKEALGCHAVCSVISNGYGSEKGLLEIEGLVTKEEMEKNNDTVLGYLTAKDVFARIEKHYREEAVS